MKEKEIIEKLNEVLDLHDEMRNCYFWSPPMNSHARRAYEDKRSLVTNFIYNEQQIEIVQETNCSCKNIYYTVTYFIDGNKVKKDIRYIKKILNELESTPNKK